MIPLKNKKKSLEFTVSEIRDFSLKYIEKYAPSKQQLRTYLLKKYLKSVSFSQKPSGLGADIINHVTHM